MEYSRKYLHLGKEIDPEDHVICRYKIDTSIPMEDAAAAIATEQSTGTWTDITTLRDDIFLKLSGRVIDIKGNIATIAFPIEDFSLDIGGVPQILSVIAGNLFGLETLKGVRLEDAKFPKSMVRAFKGPKFGIDGMRNILKRPQKPFVGTIIKPKIGLNPDEMASYVYEAGMGGLTNSKDDETLVNQRFCPLEDRVVAIAEALDKVESESGHKMIHAINISTRADRIVEIAERAQELGASEIMIDIFTCGFAALQAVAEDPSIKIPIHVHRTMHAAFTRNENHGIAMSPLAKLVRMCGGDALHVGTFGVGKMKGSPEEDLASQRSCTEELYGLKPTLPVCSGGIYPALVPELVKIAGNDIQIQAGGGVAGHPKGIRAGARAMSQAVDASFKGISLEEYARDHVELREALERWKKR
ncbi:MAG: RuBisCO large subunit C-terminal-like domain-containing protein [Methanomassiliicoccales archaeon]